MIQSLSVTANQVCRSHPPSAMQTPPPAVGRLGSQTPIGWQKPQKAAHDGKETKRLTDVKLDKRQCKKKNKQLTILRLLLTYSVYTTELCVHIFSSRWVYYIALSWLICQRMRLMILYVSVALSPELIGYY